MSAIDAWKAALESWAIPESILAQAPTTPWIHPPAMFTVPEEVSDSPSHFRARELLSDGDSILDIGCGGGVAAFAIANATHRVIGVDHQPEMLEMFAQEADRRGIQCETHVGFWPMIAESVPVADVVTCHHVVYNVQDIEPFIWTLHSHASKRVVIELPQAHPLTSMNDLWRHFWQLDRPTQPSPEMLMDVLRELNIDAHLELFDGEHRDLASFEERVELNRIRLCLPQHRDADIAAVMRSAPTPASRKLATVWWDLSQPTL